MNQFFENERCSVPIVVGDFLLRNVASGAKSSRGIKGMNKPSATKEVDAASSKELPPDKKTLEEGLMDKKVADPRR